MSNNWKTYKLGDIVSILGDGLHGTPKYTENGEYYFINGNNLSDGKIVLKSDIRRVNHDEYLKYKNSSILTSFNSKMNPILTMIFSCRTENQTLTTLRDTLIPKLISVEVRVKGAEKILEEAL